MLKPMISKLVEGRSLSESEMAEAVEHIMCGRGSEGQVGAFLAALRLKGETVDEVVGAATVMRRHATPLARPIPGLLDTCGTGGDGACTFNVSTATALVIATCGVKVAKHGNRAVSSSCGSADVLQALGVDIDADPDTVTRCIEEVGVGFLFAPNIHTAMRHVAPVRRDLAIRTVFNLLGPLTNPAGVEYQIVGVSRPEHTTLLAEALRRLGSEHAIVVHGSDGLDEITITGPTRVAEVLDDRVVEYEVEPRDAGLRPAPLEAILGGDTEANAAIIKGIISGESGPQRDVVLLNAAAALRLCGRVASLDEGAGLAGAAIDSGRVAETLHRLSLVSRESVSAEAGR